MLRKERKFSTLKIAGTELVVVDSTNSAMMTLDGNKSDKSEFFCPSTATKSIAKIEQRNMITLCFPEFNCL